MIIMTAEESVIVMIGGAGSSGGAVKEPIKIPSELQYYNYESSIQDYDVENGSYEYGEKKTIPKDSLVIKYMESWKVSGNIWHYKYTYYIYELVIENIDKIDEEVVGINDLQTGKEYRFQFNVKGGR